MPISSGATPTGNPADPQMNARTSDILGYFQQLQARNEVRVISGQFCSFGPTARLESAAKIHEGSGCWPAMIEVDYTDFARGWIETRTPNRVILDYWRTGGLVSVGVHFNNPAREEGGGLREHGLDLAEILKAGSPVHARWLRQLDAIADGLLELQSAGVTVLWRPFHEMNGRWFWWGGQDPRTFVKVWRQLFDYFTQMKGLHNLIWIYSPNTGRRVMDYYPGDRYVDLVGLDAYTDHIDPWHVPGYAELVSTGKPLGFTEFGPHGSSNPPGDFDYRRLLEGIAKHFPAIHFFLTWDEKWHPLENKFGREFYADPRVVKRRDLPSGLAGDRSAETPSRAGGTDSASPPSP